MILAIRQHKIIFNLTDSEAPQKDASLMTCGAKDVLISNDHYGWHVGIAFAVESFLVSCRIGNNEARYLSYRALSDF